MDESQRCHSVKAAHRTSLKTTRHLILWKKWPSVAVALTALDGLPTPILRLVRTVPIRTCRSCGHAPTALPPRWMAAVIRTRTHSLPQRRELQTVLNDVLPCCIVVPPVDTVRYTSSTMWIRGSSLTLIWRAGMRHSEAHNRRLSFIS